MTLTREAAERTQPSIPRGRPTPNRLCQGFHSPEHPEGPKQTTQPRSTSHTRALATWGTKACMDDSKN